MIVVELREETSKWLNQMAKELKTTPEAVARTIIEQKKKEETCPTKS